MRRLLVDIGNTRLKWAVADGTQILERGAVDNPSGRLVLTRVWETVGRPEMIAAIAVGDRGVLSLVSSVVLELWQAEVMELRTGTFACGVLNGYEIPQALGIDRWAAMLGAWAPGQPLFVADCGTALTIDCITSRGQHLGGYIAPGQALMRMSLHEGTQALSGMPAHYTQPARAPGRNTGTAVAAGCDGALCGLLEWARNHFERDHGSAVAVVTGGGAPLIMPLLGSRWHHDPDLVFKGMLHLIEESVRL